MFGEHAGGCLTYELPLLLDPNIVGSSMPTSSSGDMSDQTAVRLMQGLLPYPHHDGRKSTGSQITLGSIGRVNEMLERRHEHDFALNL